ncbi:peptidoglycan-associated lipoprotein Pal [Chachezhania antarctica]|uniref:peptidoglycan-associated lipoprotein Pal n=1 Tax=Chachezhania antarctica TaxID=2340860 RepID=UPI000EB0EFF0|nr:peptidoglycan-associated lipoprotein Pal [Chachezhania antarctica]
MNIFRMGVLVAAVLTAAACTNARNLDGGAGAAAGAGAGSALSNPSSPVYFQQAVGDRVLFLVDQSSLTEQARQTLNSQAQWLNNNGSYTATVEGHADEQGTREYNLALGARRANEARDYLISRGVAGNRLSVVSYGKERPLEICSEESCYAKNRRAVTVLSGGLSG